MLVIKGSKYCECWENGKTSSSGWSKDEETGYWVCGACRKPSRYATAKECDSCERKFLPNKPIEDDALEILCERCTA